MDDVNYLRQHATEESFLFVADSARRDTAVYPQPNHYEIVFNSPFRNVVGLDLIDATLPRTEYLVEAGRNALVYTYGNQRHTAVVEPGDYNILQLVAVLNGLLAPRLTVRVTSTPPEISNKVSLVSDRPFTVHIPESTLAKALGLGVSSLRATELTAGALGTRAVIEGPLPVSHEVDLHTPRRQPFIAPATGTPRAVWVYIRSAYSREVHVAVVSESNTLIASGTVLTSHNNVLEKVTVELQPHGRLTKDQTYYVVVGCDTEPYYVWIYTDSFILPTATGAPRGAWWDYETWDDGLGKMCMDMSMTVDAYVVEPPNVVDLTGEPYVLVRCPEVEQLLYRDRAHETVHAGLGLVKLGNYGFRDQRFDFTSFPPRILPTPIGKLPKLTIRLEKGDGTLYDTKGVNHHLVLVIRYLEITQGPKSIPSVLNPQYTPNPLEYLQAQRVQRMS